MIVFFGLMVRDILIRKKELERLDEEEKKKRRKQEEVEQEKQRRLEEVERLRQERKRREEEEAERKVRGRHMTKTRRCTVYFMFQLFIMTGEVRVGTRSVIFYYMYICTLCTPPKTGLNCMNLTLTKLWLHKNRVHDSLTVSKLPYILAYKYVSPLST